MGKRDYLEMPCTDFQVSTWERENILKCHVQIFRSVHGKERFCHFKFYLRKSLYDQCVSRDFLFGNDLRIRKYKKKNYSSLYAGR